MPAVAFSSYAANRCLLLLDQAALDLSPIFDKRHPSFPFTSQIVIGRQSANGQLACALSRRYGTFLVTGLLW